MTDLPEYLYFRCPWCGSVCVALTDTFEVLHPLPMCASFAAATGPTEVLAAANARLGAKN